MHMELADGARGSAALRVQWAFTSHNNKGQACLKWLWTGMSYSSEKLTFQTGQPKKSFGSFSGVWALFQKIAIRLLLCKLYNFVVMCFAEICLQWAYLRYYSKVARYATRLC